MELRLDEGQQALQETVARFCDDRFPLDAVTGRVDEPTDRSTWTAMADLGVLGLLDPASGLGVVDAAIAFEQLGGRLAPGPLLWTALAAPLVPGAGAGEQLVAGLHTEDLDDGAAIVPHLPEADVLLVVHDDQVTAHRTADLTTEESESLDPLASAGRVLGLDATATGEQVGDAEAAADLRTKGTVLAAAMLSGLADRALQVARAHALDRLQFGAPIGSFQAVKHLLADMYVRGAVAQSATYAAAAVLDDPGGDDPRQAAAAAKALAGEAALANAATAVQVLGGMGFTWDMLPNFLLKRAWSLELELGTTEAHNASLGAALGAAVAGATA